MWKIQVSYKITIIYNNLMMKKTYYKCWIILFSIKINNYCIILVQKSTLDSKISMKFQKSAKVVKELLAQTLFSSLSTIIIYKRIAKRSPEKIWIHNILITLEQVNTIKKTIKKFLMTWKETLIMSSSAQ
jgi:hypothetical protein